MTKKCNILIAILANTLLAALNLNTVNALSVNTAVVNYHLGQDTILTDSIDLQYDITTNLLVDKNNKNLMQITNNGTIYTLDEVEITRHRRKITMEYYLGDYENNTLIGTDTGYADVEDYISEYFLTINDINEKFNQSLTSDYVTVYYDQSSTIRYVPAFNGSEEDLVVKVLVAKPQSYKLAISSYQNKQNQNNPSPVGKTKTDIDSETEFWRVREVTRTIKAIHGQIINIKSLSAVSDQLTQGSRTGTLRVFGYYNYTTGNTFTISNTLTIDLSTPATVYIGAFYEVEDYDYSATPVSPGFSSGTIGTAGIGFYGGEGWKSEAVSEILKVGEEAQLSKLKAYPFNLDGDPFDTPEYFVWVESNWALKHKITLDYYYLGEAEPTPTPSDNNNNNQSTPEKEITVPEAPDEESTVPEAPDEESIVPETSEKESTIPETGHSNNYMGLVLLTILSLAFLWGGKKASQS